MNLSLTHITKISLTVILSTAIYLQTNAQSLSSSDLKKITIKEDSLKSLAENFHTDSLTAGRMRSDSLFVKTLIRTLQIKNSFHYPLDSVFGVSKVYAPDSSFRILSWNLSFDQYYSRQRAAIQFNTADGSLKLVPLRDVSEFTENAMDSVRTKNNWIGAVYYRIIKTSHNNKDFYTLVGFDDYSALSNKKWLEVMSFNSKNEPVFGGPFFSFEEDSIKKPVQYRYNIEYKKEARAVLEYDEELELIIIDHLISETGEPENKFTYIPDGDVEAFKWKNGKWVHVDKLYDFKLEDGEFPMPAPIRDKQGNLLPVKQ